MLTSILPQEYCQTSAAITINEKALPLERSDVDTSSLIGYNEKTTVQKNPSSDIKRSSLSSADKTEHSSEKLDSARLSSQSIIAMLNMVMLYLQQYASWMRNNNLNTAALLTSKNMEGALDALHKMQQSAQTELSAKQWIYGAQIAAGIGSIAITLLGGWAAHSIFRDRGPEAILGMAMLASGVSGGMSHLITSGAEKWKSSDLTAAQIEKAQADNQRQLLSILETVRSWQSNLGEQMSNQFQQINSIVIDIYRGFSKFFETPIA